MFIYLTFILLIITGHIKDLFGRIFQPGKYKRYTENNKNPPLFTIFESFFIRRLYRRIRDCWNRPISGVPGKTLIIKKRVSYDNNESFTIQKGQIKALNFGSYNYLGFATNSGKIIKKDIKILKKYKLMIPYSQKLYRNNKIARKLEKLIAKFINKEDCIVYQMGYGTNITAISSLMNNSLILSDEYNHRSLINGMKLTNSHIEIFKHNNMKDLENKLKNFIIKREENKILFNKIFVVVEGLYSMEGTVPDLKKIIELKLK